MRHFKIQFSMTTRFPSRCFLLLSISLRPRVVSDGENWCAYRRSNWNSSFFPIRLPYMPRCLLPPHDFFYNYYLSLFLYKLSINHVQQLAQALVVVRYQFPFEFQFYINLNSNSYAEQTVLFHPTKQIRVKRCLICDAKLRSL